MGDELNKFLETPDISKVVESCSFDWEIPIDKMDFSVEREEILEDSAGNLIANYLVKVFPLDLDNHEKLLICNVDLELLENSAQIILTAIEDKNISNITEEQFNYTTSKIMKLLFFNKIKYGYLVEEIVLKKLKENINKLVINPSKTIRFEIAKGIDAKNGNNSDLKFHVPIEKIVGTLSNNGTIDYKNIGTGDRILSKGTKICTLHHATEGSNGINIFGKVLKAKDGTEKDKIKIGTENTIELVENIETNSADFIATSKGLVFYHQVSGKLELKSEIETKEISFKNIGNISENSERLDMNIKGQKGSIDDAIKDGFELYAGNISVIGNIGNKVSIDCLSLQIEGKINAGSSILSENFVKSKNIYGTTIVSKLIQIGTCMDSQLKGDFIVITKAATSQIEGKTVIITDSVKNCSITASELIVVGKTFPMDNNIFNIAPLELVEYREKLEIVEHKLASFKKQVKNLQTEIEQHTHKAKLIKRNIIRAIMRLNELPYSAERETSLGQLIENKQFKALKQSLTISKSIETNITEFVQLKNKIDGSHSKFKIKAKALEKFELEQNTIKNMFCEGIVLFISSAGTGTKVIFQNFEKIIPHNIAKSAVFCFDKTSEKTVYKSADYSTLNKVWNNLPDNVKDILLEQLPNLKSFSSVFEGIIQ